MANSPNLDHVYAENFSRRWIILLSVTLAAIMEVLDTTIINVALPQMAGNLGATIQDIAWVSTAYILANVVVLPLTGFFTTRFGRRNYLTASIVLFTLSSFMCGIGHSFLGVVMWRFLQGAAGAALISTAQATLIQVFPPEEQGIVQPIFFMGIVVAPAIGPALGGWLTDVLTWNWCFLINVPIGIIAAATVYINLKNTQAAEPDGKIDWLGIGLMSTGLAVLQYILEEGEQDDWFQSDLIVKLSMLSAFCLISLIFWLFSPRNTNPIINVRILRNASLLAGITLFIVAGLGLYGVIFLYPLLAQSLEGMTAQQTGMALLPGGLTTAFRIVATAMITTRPGNTIDSRRLILIGTIILTTALWFLGHLTPQSGSESTFWPLLVRGIAIGLIFIPINTTAISSLSPSDVGQGASFLALGRQIGGSFGIAILATYLNSHLQTNRSLLINHINNSNPLLNNRVAEITSGFVNNGLTYVNAHNAALGLIDRAVSTQAAAMSYNDTFQLLAIIGVVTMPAIFMLSKPSSNQAMAMK